MSAVSFDEDEVPLPPNTKCIALEQYVKEYPDELTFEAGDVLTILKPSEVLFWYLAENSDHQRGIVPITFLKVMTDDQELPSILPRPAAPLRHIQDAAITSDNPAAEKVPPRLPDAPDICFRPPMPAPRNEGKLKHAVQKNFLSSPKQPFPEPYLPRSHSTNNIEPFKAPIASNSMPSISSFALPGLPPKPRELPPGRPEALMTVASVEAARKPEVLPRKPKTSSRCPDLPTKITQNLPTKITSEHVRALSIQPRLKLGAPSQVVVQPGGSMLRNPVPMLPGDYKSYPTMEEFRDCSGWFKPTVENVLASKIQMSLMAFERLTNGIYFFQHKWVDEAKYVGWSNNLRVDLIQMFQQLYNKVMDDLNPIERALRVQYPDASLWTMRAWRIENPDDITFEATKLIVKHRTLRPSGLNTEMKLLTSAHWDAFKEWYLVEWAKWV